MKMTGSGKVYTTVNYLNGSPYEVFVAFGHAGSEERALTEALGRLFSIALQSGIPLAALYKHLRGISSELAVGLGPNKVLSVPDAVAQSLKEASYGYQ